MQHPGSSFVVTVRCSLSRVTMILLHLLYNLPDEEGKVQVVIKDETILCTQKAMALLFGVDKSGISRHISNIFNPNRSLGFGLKWNTTLHNMFFKMAFFKHFEEQGKPTKRCYFLIYELYVKISYRSLYFFFVARLLNIYESNKYKDAFLIAVIRK